MMRKSDQLFTNEEGGGCGVVGYYGVAVKMKLRWKGRLKSWGRGDGKKEGGRREGVGGWKVGWDTVHVQSPYKPTR